MSQVETPFWFDEDMANCILIVGIYFKELKNNVQNDARIWLKNTLRRQLEKYAEKIEPIEYALTRYVPHEESDEKVKGKAGKSKGGEYKYQLTNAKPELFETLFKFLEEAKNKGKPSWLGDYYVLVSKPVVKEVVLNEW